MKLSSSVTGCSSLAPRKEKIFQHQHKSAEEELLRCFESSTPHVPPSHEILSKAAIQSSVQSKYPYLTEQHLNSHSSNLEVIKSRQIQQIQPTQSIRIKTTPPRHLPSHLKTINSPLPQQQTSAQSKSKVFINQSKPQSPQVQCYSPSKKLVDQKFKPQTSFRQDNLEESPCSLQSTLLAFNSSALLNFRNNNKDKVSSSNNRSGQKNIVTQQQFKAFSPPIKKTPQNLQVNTSQSSTLDQVLCIAQSQESISQSKLVSPNTQQINSSCSNDQKTCSSKSKSPSALKKQNVNIQSNNSQLKKNVNIAKATTSKNTKQEWQYLGQTNSILTQNLLNAKNFKKSLQCVLSNNNFKEKQQLQQQSQVQPSSGRSRREKLVDFLGESQIQLPNDQNKKYDCSERGDLSAKDKASSRQGNSCFQVSKNVPTSTKSKSETRVQTKETYPTHSRTQSENSEFDGLECSERFEIANQTDLIQLPVSANVDKQIMMSFAESLRSSVEAPREKAQSHLKTQFIGDYSGQCCNHPSKKGKYRVEEKSQTINSLNSASFCSKCAIELAGKGLKIVESEQVLKKGVIERFMGYLNKDVIDILQMGLDKCDESEDVIQKEYSQVLAEVNKQFDSMQRMLENKREDIVKGIMSTQQKSIELCQSTKNSLRSHVVDIQNMQRDISSNIQQIIKDIAISPFKDIISQYQEKCSFFLSNASNSTQQSYNLSQISNSSLLRQLDLPTIQASLLTLLNSINLNDLNKEESNLKISATHNMLPQQPLLQQLEQAQAPQPLLNNQLSEQDDLACEENFLQGIMNPNVLALNILPSQNTENDYLHIGNTNNSGQELKSGYALHSARNQNLSDTKKNINESLKNENLYISFENREMFFQAAGRSASESKKGLGGEGDEVEVNSNFVISPFIDKYDVFNQNDNNISVNDDDSLSCQEYSYKNNQNHNSCIAFPLDPFNQLLTTTPEKKVSSQNFKSTSNNNMKEFYLPPQNLIFEQKGDTFLSQKQTADFEQSQKLNPNLMMEEQLPNKEKEEIYSFSQRQAFKEEGLQYLKDVNNVSNSSSNSKKNTASNTKGNRYFHSMSETGMKDICFNNSKQYPSMSDHHMHFQEQEKKMEKHSLSPFQPKQQQSQGQYEYTSNSSYKNPYLNNQTISPRGSQSTGNVLTIMKDNIPKKLDLQLQQELNDLTGEEDAEGAEDSARTDLSSAERPINQCQNNIKQYLSENKQTANQSVPQHWQTEQQPDKSLKSQLVFSIEQQESKSQENTSEWYHPFDSRLDLQQQLQQHQQQHQQQQSQNGNNNNNNNDYLLNMNGVLVQSKFLEDYQLKVMSGSGKKVNSTAITSMTNNSNYSIGSFNNQHSNSSAKAKAKNVEAKSQHCHSSSLSKKDSEQSSLKKANHTRSNLSSTLVPSTSPFTVFGEITNSQSITEGNEVLVGTKPNDTPLTSLHKYYSLCIQQEKEGI